MAMQVERGELYRLESNRLSRAHVEGTIANWTAAKPLTCAGGRPILDYSGHKASWATASMPAALKPAYKHAGCGACMPAEHYLYMCVPHPEW